MSCMAWAQDPVDGSERLFTGGLDGALTEWDLRTRRPRHVGDSFGGAVWAMAAEPRGQMKEGPQICSFSSHGNALQPCCLHRRAIITMASTRRAHIIDSQGSLGRLGRVSGRVGYGGIARRGCNCWLPFWQCLLTPLTLTNEFLETAAAVSRRTCWLCNGTV